MRGKRLAVKILVYFTFITCLGAVIFLLGYRVRHPQPDRPNAHRYENPSPQVAETNQENDAKVDRHAAENYDGYAAKWTDPIVILTFLLLVVASIAAYVYYGQLKEMRQTVALVGQQAGFAQGQLVAVQHQEQAQFAQLEVMRQQVENARIAERAYIGIEAAAIRDLDVGKVPFIAVDFLNGGRTPAYDVHTPARLLIDVKPPETWPPQPIETEGGFLAAGKSRPIRYSFETVADDTLIAQLRRKIVRVYLRGEIWFKDAWGEQQNHTFHLVWLPRPGVFQDYKTFLREQTEADHAKAHSEKEN